MLNEPMHRIDIDFSFFVLLTQLLFCKGFMNLLSVCLEHEKFALQRHASELVTAVQFVKQCPHRHGCISLAQQNLTLLELRGVFCFQLFKCLPQSIEQFLHDAAVVAEAGLLMRHHEEYVRPLIIGWTLRYCYLNALDLAGRLIAMLCFAHVN